MKKGLLIVMLVIGLMGVGIASAVTSVSSCGTLSIPGETYVLTADVVTSPSADCFVVSASGVTLDCQGHTIIGQSSSWRGVYFNSGSGSIVQNCNIQGFGDSAITIELSSSGNTVTGNILTNNNNGVTFNSAGPGNTVTYNTIHSLGNGLLLVATSNNIVHSNIVDSDSNAITVITPGYSSGNLIYNNKFNAPGLLSYSDAPSNTWYTTPVAGTNILGGSLIAGNAWVNPSSTGFSNTCIDANSDGICDSPYQIYSSLNTFDLYPLKANMAPVVCGNGIVEGTEQCDDGNTNNGDCCSSTCQNEPAGTQTCGIGACQVTTARCNSGVPVVCTPGTPTTEICNGIDDNCNGIVDDGTCGAAQPPSSPNSQGQGPYPGQGPQKAVTQGSAKGQAQKSAKSPVFAAVADLASGEVLNITALLAIVAIVAMVAFAVKKK